MNQRNLYILAILTWLPLLGMGVVRILDPGTTADPWPMVYSAGLIIALAAVRFGMHYGRLGMLDRLSKLSFLLPPAALGALFAPSSYALALMIVLLGAQGALDAWSGHKGLVPAPYVAARRVQTILACVTLTVIFVGANAVPTPVAV